ncbi:type I DNA topoisomerase [Williamwhitmania taraxaci]|uniref:DNA topoisomerase 1 n=1 Tax=Williamwhitmania taraxaci TaxID=1640674 RepID=A0A1G6SQT6_9BACT|nr:type I DNA topoisomerase [Williamwhitmania taraxaci]SDD18961.1 DNA topoisomerase I [Williamwhitmania taraxaci]
MQDNLVIVESPAKAKTIEKFLGKDFLVKSSFGHIRDLSKNKLSIDVDNNFEPSYTVDVAKKKMVTELKELAAKAKIVWLASDEDREGEAIAWHLKEVLELDPAKTKRIVFHEITKEAILNAIKSPRQIDQNLVNAQQARRILDRLVGYEVSPILWKKVRPSLSAGRVQSVAVRLIVEREREIMAFAATSNFRIQGLFTSVNGDLKAELDRRFTMLDEAKRFLNHCVTARFTIEDISKKPAKKSPAAPFTTSTLQQEASRKLGFSVAQTMTVAQKLYEAGLITYMRTDSVNLSDTALTGAQSVIEAMYGNKYHLLRRFKTKSKGAQEAHEAIRPTYMENTSVEGTSTEKRLYDLIWKRTIASQMADAAIEKTTITIGVSDAKERFEAVGEVLLFDGFLKVYIEGTDDENEDESSTLLPKVTAGEKLSSKYITATERFTQKPPRYTEASLVKKMEELGIGRPSTYAPTISTIATRGYVLKEDRDGLERSFTILKLTNGKVHQELKTEIFGAEKSKLFPSDIGILVTDFLTEHFTSILSYDFTANVEKEFDEIALGTIEWTKMLRTFYTTFHTKVEETTLNSQPSKGERLVGLDPRTGKQIYVRIGRFGPIAQLGESETTSGEKPQYASLQKGQLIESLTLEEALKLFDLPRKLGQYEEEEITVAIGKFGPYIKHKSKFFSIKKDQHDPYTITIDEAITLIKEKLIEDKNKIITEFSEKAGLKVLNGRFGPYITFEKNNYKIPKGTDPASLSLDDCLKIIEETDANGGPKKGKASRFAKSTKVAAKPTKTTKTTKTSKPKSAGAAKTTKPKTKK